jgi:protein-S-isoprenylcysteine O-methyltransferase Ste14
MPDPVRRPATWVLPPAPYALALYASWWLDRHWQHLPLEMGWLNAWLGGALIAVGLWLFGWTLLTFWRHRTTVNPYLAASHLCVDGPFRRTRNPIYLGDWFIYAGVGLWLATWWPLAFVLPVWAIIRYGVIRHEEAHLEAKFGEAYRTFRANVKRWL